MINIDNCEVYYYDDPEYAIVISPFDYGINGLKMLFSFGIADHQYLSASWSWRHPKYPVTDVYKNSMIIKYVTDLANLVTPIREKYFSNIKAAFLDCGVPIFLNGFLPSWGFTKKYIDLNANLPKEWFITKWFKIFDK